MKRHENLHSAILSFVVAVIFLVAGLVVNFVVIKPLIADDNTPLENFIFTMLPALLYLAAALFLITGGYALANDIMIEKGETITADLTSINEYFVGRGTSGVHYNVFCEWKNPANGKKYKFRAKNLPTNPKQKFADGKVLVKINKSDPRQYYIIL